MEKGCIMAETTNEFIINTGDDSNEEEEFKAVDSSDSKDNEICVNSDNSYIAQPLWTPNI